MIEGAPILLPRPKPNEHPDVLPDGRIRAANRKTIRMRDPANPGTTREYEWVYCDCGDGGPPNGPLVPVDDITFAFYLCTKCEAKGLGIVAGMMRLPDDTFRARAVEAQLVEAGRPMTIPELAAKAAEPDSLFAKLCKDFDNDLRRRAFR